MHLLTHLTLLASTIPLALSAALTTTFALNAVVLTTQHTTPLAVELSESSMHILRATGPNTTSDTTPAASRFAFAAASRQLWNGEYGLSDAARANASVTFGAFDPPADGQFAVQASGGGTYFVYGGEEGGEEGEGLLDGWSLCATEAVVAFYWSGTQGALDGCVKVALERQ